MPTRSLLSIALAAVFLAAVLPGIGSIALGSPVLGYPALGHPGAALDVNQDEGGEDPPPPPKKNLRIPPDLDVRKGDHLRGLIDDVRRAEDVGTSSKAMKKMAKRFQQASTKIDIPLTHYYYARVLQHLRDFKNARKFLERAVSQNPEFFEAHCELGIVCSRLGDSEASLDHYRKSVEIYAHYPPALEGYAVALVREKKIEEAHKHIARAHELDPTDRREQLAAEIAEELQGTPFRNPFTAESDHYRIVTDTSQETADKLAVVADKAFVLYRRALPSLSAPAGKLDVQVFASETVYNKATGFAAEEEGHYSALFGRLKMVEAETWDQTVETFQRHAIVQLIHHGLNEVPIWFLEGCKAYFQMASLDLVDEKDLWVRPSTTDHMTAIGSIKGGRSRTLQELMVMNRDEFGESTKNAAHAWSVVYFCLQGGNTQYQQTVDAYLGEIQRGATAHGAYERSFGKIKERSFIKEWKRYICDTLPKLMRG